MGKRYKPTSEELKNILDWYTETNNYSEVSRRTGISPQVIKRIVTEYTGKTNIVYNGNLPLEDSRYVFKYDNYYKELELLSNEVRSNNGILQD